MDYRRFSARLCSAITARGFSASIASSAEEVVAVAVRRTDRRHVFSSRGDPIRKRACLIHCNEGVYYNRCFAPGEIVSDGGYAGRHEYVPRQRFHG